jgi:tetraacyldisaccharide-1-P 4'-kinase
MKTSATTLLGLGLCGLALAQDPKPQSEAKQTHPCLAVSTTSPEGFSGQGPFRTFFYYLESKDLPVKDIQGHYKKKDLEKLESRGVKIVVTTKDAVSVRQNESQTDTKTGSETNSSIRAQTSASCN